MSDVSRFLKHSGIYAIGNALNRLGAFLLLPLYTRYLTPGEYGTLELFYALSALISTVLAVGLSHATLRFYFDYEDDADRRSVVSTNFLAAVAISIVGALIVGLAGDRIAGWVLGAPPPAWAMPAMLATIVFELSSQICLAYLRAREKSLFFITLALVKLVVQCAANTLLLMHYDAGVAGVLSGNLLAVVVGWLVAAGYTLRHCGLRFEWAKLLPVLHYTLPFVGATLLAVLGANLDRFLVTHLLSLEALGIYALAMKFSKLISDLIGEPFNRAYGAFRYTIMDRADAAATQARITRYVAALLAAVALAVALLTGDVLRLMATPQFWPAGGLMPMLAAAAALQTLVYPLQSGIFFSKNTQHMFTLTVQQFVLGIVVGVPLIWAFGLQGLCATQLVLAAINLAATHYYSQRYFPVQYELRRLAWLAVLWVAFWAASLPLALWALPAWAGILLKLALVAGFALALLASPVLAAPERAQLLARGRLLLGGAQRPAA
jgi:O-antigen/teichoic acid export membrane protein